MASDEIRNKAIADYEYKKKLAIVDVETKRKNQLLRMTSVIDETFTYYISVFETFEDKYNRFYPTIMDFFISHDTRTFLPLIILVSPRDLDDFIEFRQRLGSNGSYFRQNNYLYDPFIDLYVDLKIKPRVHQITRPGHILHGSYITLAIELNTHTIMFTFSESLPTHHLSIVNKTEEKSIEIKNSGCCIIL